MQQRNMLTVTDHSRQRAGLRYVYPVLSRRSGGLSVGVNLNPNNACNWRCVYCQVEGLQRGAAPRIDVALLHRELEDFIRQVVCGDYLERHLPVGFRVLKDIAISGNGEPTTAKEFAEVVETIGAVRTRFGLGAAVKTVLITNGSQLHHHGVQVGVRSLVQWQGEVWFKVDRATAEGLWEVNRTRIPVARVEENVRLCAELCPTWIQTCWFACDGLPPAPAELAAYLEFLRQVQERGAKLRGVLLYTLARPSAQPEGIRLAPLPAEALERVAERIRALGLEVRVSP
ncbi:MAG: radical SAM protein [Candidatus Binatia bacterium]|nr:radical SAM protein [Candidatus Binatia bacterium]